MKLFYITTFDINNFKHPWFSPCTWRNKIMFNRRSVDLKKSWSHSRALTVKLLVLRLWRHGVEWDCGVIAEVDNGWGEYIGSDVYAWNVRFDSGLILFFFLFILRSKYNGPHYNPLTKRGNDKHLISFPVASYLFKVVKMCATVHWSESHSSCLYFIW